MREYDFFFSYDESIVLLLPQTDNAIDFVKENINLDDWQNEKRIAIEPRYFDNLLDGILENNLTIKMI